MTALVDGLARRAAAAWLARSLAAWCFAASALAGSLAVLALLAYAQLLDGARWPAAAWWLAVAAVLAWTAVRLSGRRHALGSDGLRRIAVAVEREHALRRGSLAGLVDLAEHLPDGHSVPLAERAGRMLEQRLPERCSRWAPREFGRLRRRLKVAAATLGASLAALAAVLVFAGDAAAALVSPVAAFRGLVTPRITVAVSSREVRKGGDLIVTVRVEAVSGPVLHLRETGESWRAVELEADPRGVVRHRVQSLRADLYLFATAGSAVSETLRVRVMEPPFIASLVVTASYPAYLAREEQVLDAFAPLVVPAGTRLRVEGVASAAVRSAALRREAGDFWVPLRARGPDFRGELLVQASGRWRLEAADGTGSLLEPVPLLDVRAVPDSAPVVAVPVPGADTTAPLDLRAGIVADLRDDHALHSAEVVSWRVSRLGVVGDTMVEPLPGAAGADRVVLSHMLDLTQRGLLPGDTLRFFVRARDRAPVPNVGRSREFALRLRSMSELREAVRTGADSLAAAAGELASDQGELTRRTEDLAAQRNRGQDRPRPAPGRSDVREDPRTATPQGAVPFEQAAEAQRILEQQQRLLERAARIREDLERLSRAAEEVGLDDRQWQEQLRNLQALLREAVTPELRERLEELRRALERLDPQAVQQALRRMNQEQQRLRDELRRSAELFERAALEGSLQAAARDADQLYREQREWAERSTARSDSTAAAAEQRQLATDADSLARRLEQLAERLAQRGDSSGSARVDSAGELVESASSQMSRAAEAMQQGRRQDAGREGQRAAELLRDVPDALRQSQQEMAARWRSETLRILDQALQETIALASEQQRFAREVRRGEGGGPGEQRGRQSAAEQGIQQILRRLQQASGQHALVSPRLGAQLAQARQEVAQSRQALEGPSPSVDEAAERAGQAAQRLAQAAFSLLRNRDEVAGAQSGSGLAEAIERMARMAGQQGELNDELGGLIPMLGGGQEAVMDQLRALAERQRRLANELERLGETGMPGNPDQLAEEARQLADRIESARLDRQTLERQQRLFRRMLDAGRSLRNEDEPDDPERRSETARNAASRGAPAEALRHSALRYPAPSWSALRRLSPSERAMVLDYFRRLNERP